MPDAQLGSAPGPPPPTGEIACTFVCMAWPLPPTFDATSAASSLCSNSSSSYSASTEPIAPEIWNQ